MVNIQSNQITKNTPPSTGASTVQKAPTSTVKDITFDTVALNDNPKEIQAEITRLKQELQTAKKELPSISTPAVTASTKIVGILAELFFKKRPEEARAASRKLAVVDEKIKIAKDEITLTKLIGEKAKLRSEILDACDKSKASDEVKTLYKDFCDNEKIVERLTVAEARMRILKARIEELEIKLKAAA